MTSEDIKHQLIIISLESHTTRARIESQQLGSGEQRYIKATNNNNKIAQIMFYWAISTS